jgi:hypothetical protein
MYGPYNGDDDSDIVGTEDDTLTTVYENDANEILAFEDSEDEFLDDDDDNDRPVGDESDPDDGDILSGLSEEDDSDIEEDLQFAVQQIKMQQNEQQLPNDSPLTTGSSGRVRIHSMSSGMLPSSSNILPSPGPSPRSRRPTGASTGSTTSLIHRRVPKKQRSLDIGFNSLVGPALTAPAGRRMSVPSRSRAKTADGRLSPGNPLAPSRDQKPVRTDVSASSSMKGEAFPSEEQIAAQAKLDAGLGLDVVGQLSACSAGTIYSNGSFSGSGKLGGSLRSLSTVSKTSLLTAQIRAKQASFDNPLEQYVAASGKSERKPLRLKMFMPSSTHPKEPWEVIVRTDANVASAIGFALYCYQERNLDTPLPLELCDANKWNLMIVEDDGEPDEDFPALDRTRLVSAYSFDEFALVKATPEQVRKNELETPNTRKPVTTSNSGAGGGGGGESKPRHYVMTTPQNDSVTVRVYQYPFDEILSKVYWEAALARTTKIGTILETVCRDKVMDCSMYVLKIAGRKVVATSAQDLQSLDGRYNLEITPKRVITLANGYETEHTNPNTADTLRRAASTTRSVYSALASRGAEDAKVYRQSVVMAGATLPEILTTAGYHKYQVWRRQPMSFIGRHERVLAIDGEYVHIMPPEDRTLFDSPKTSTFHMNQVMKCKQSTKVPANFKIVVRKTSGPKRYDLEAVSAAQSAEIVNKIRSLAYNYRTAE